MLMRRRVPPPRRGGGGPPKAVEEANAGRLHSTICPLHHAAHGPPPPSQATGEELRPRRAPLASLCLARSARPLAFDELPHLRHEVVARHFELTRPLLAPRPVI